MENKWPYEKKDEGFKCRVKMSCEQNITFKEVLSLTFNLFKFGKDTIRNTHLVSMENIIFLNVLLLWRTSFSPISL